MFQRAVESLRDVRPSFIIGTINGFEKAVVRSATGLGLVFISKNGDVILDMSGSEGRTRGIYIDGVGWIFQDGDNGPLYA